MLRCSEGKERMAAALRVKGSGLSKEEGPGRMAAGEADPRGTGLSGKSCSDI